MSISPGPLISERSKSSPRMSVGIARTLLPSVTKSTVQNFIMHVAGTMVFRLRGATGKDIDGIMLMVHWTGNEGSLYIPLHRSSELA